jgi:integral membrane protein (TIGR01906 family)
VPPGARSLTDIADGVSQAGPWLVALRVLGMIFIALAMPVLLTTSAVRWVTLDESFYNAEFERYDVAITTGLPSSELRRVAHEFNRYFTGPPGRMEVTVATTSGPVPLFNDRELTHMEDVQAIMHLLFRLWVISFAAILLGGALVVLVDPPTGGREVIRAFGVGGGLVVGALGLLGLGALIDFQRLFFQFHLLSFSNDLWLLDPTRDRLIQLFPQEFFFDAAMRIALFTVGGGVLLLVTAFAAVRFIPEPAPGR